MRTVAVIVVAFGAAAGAVGSATAGAAASVIVVGAAGLTSYRVVARVPRRGLQLFVGAMLTTFGIFWGAEGAGVSWPGEDAAILVILVLVVLWALVLVSSLRRQHERVAAAVGG